jgi:hypothetical protein
MQEEYNRLFEYRDGELYWKINNGNQSSINSIAGGHVANNYLGVRRASINRFTAYFNKNGKPLYLGSFINEKEAAAAYDKELEKNHGEFALTNKKLYPEDFT